MKKRWSPMKTVIGGVMGILLLVGMVGCATTQGAGSASVTSIQPPVIKLSEVQLAHYWGWYYFSKKVKPTKGKANNYGAPMDLAFIFEITNPNSFPVQLDGFKFTVAFEEFDVNTLNAFETMWIPAGKTNEIAVHGMFDGRTSLLSLLVTGGFKLKAKHMNVWQQLEKWWTGIATFSFPISVKEGAATFRAGGKSIVTGFSGKFPQ
ncbi:MAG: hypothetical protein GWP10_14865 [Nitrospiraceae bacterium]|nr:hypothetical protein [Nitrospiraceae bacterium]